MPTDRERRLREWLSILHDVGDDVNAQYGTAQRLCLFCGARTFNAGVGIEHGPYCALLIARNGLQETEE